MNLKIRPISTFADDLKKRKLHIDMILKRSRRSLSWFRKGEDKFGDAASSISQREKMNAEPWTVSFLKALNC
jgi:hypothetical protein